MVSLGLFAGFDPALDPAPGWFCCLVPILLVILAPVVLFFGFAFLFRLR